MPPRQERMPSTTVWQSTAGQEDHGPGDRPVPPYHAVRRLSTRPRLLATSPQLPLMGSWQSVEARSQLVEDVLSLLHLLGPLPYANTLRPLPTTGSSPPGFPSCPLRLIRKTLTPASRYRLSVSHVAPVGMPPLHRIPRSRQGARWGSEVDASLVCPQDPPIGSVPSSSGLSRVIDVPANPVTHTRAVMTSQGPRESAWITEISQPEV